MGSFHQGTMNVYKKKIELIDPVETEICHSRTKNDNMMAALNEEPGVTVIQCPGVKLLEQEASVKSVKYYWINKVIGQCMESVEINRIYPLGTLTISIKIHPTTVDIFHSETGISTSWCHQRKESGDHNLRGLHLLGATNVCTTFHVSPFTT